MSNFYSGTTYERKRVCNNCREPLAGLHGNRKYCERCSPHVYRMNSRNKKGFKTQKWTVSSKACIDCGKLYPTPMMASVWKQGKNPGAEEGDKYLFVLNRCKECQRNLKALYQRARKTRQQDLPATLTSEQWRETLEGTDYKCVYCGAPWEHQDHFVPVSMGGGFTVNNVVPACGECNRKKNGLHPFEYIRSL